MTARPKEFRKGLVALGAGLVEALSLGLLPDPWAKYAAVAVAILGGAGVVRVPNEPPASV